MRFPALFHGSSLEQNALAVGSAACIAESRLQATTIASCCGSGVGYCMREDKGMRAPWRIQRHASLRAPAALCACLLHRSKRDNHLTGQVMQKIMAIHCLAPFSIVRNG